MYNLLLTDDEVLTLESTRAVLEEMKERLSIDRIFTADSKNAAIAVFQKERVDILVCDVEMPQSSGLDLADWVRSHHYRTEIIFLTCHADFSYVRRALTLESLDYLLKPVDSSELATTILKAITRLQSGMSAAEKNERLSVPADNSDLVCQRFWAQVVCGEITGTASEIAAAAQRQAININADTPVVLVLQSFHGYWDTWKEEDFPVIEYARKNLASELLLGDRKEGAVLSQWEHMLLIVCCPADTEDIPQLRDNCRHFIDICSHHLSMGVACYLSRACLPDKVYQEAMQLHRAERKNVYRNNQVFSCEELTALDGQIQQPDIEPWRQMLMRGLYKEAMEDIVAYFQKPEVYGKIDDKFLLELRRNLDRMFYSLYLKLGISPDGLTETYQTQFEKAARSIPDLLIWISSAVQVLKSASVSTGTENVIEQVKRYIRENLDRDISREDIASYVYLNADYLSRIFKRQEGIALMEYLIQERMKVAKNLLRESNIPVSDIALSVGYSNFSNFSKIFKKKVGLNPGDYRKKYRS